MTYITTRGADLYYEEWGAPTSEHTVLLAHGLMGSIAHMAGFAERPADIAFPDTQHEQAVVYLACLRRERAL